MSADAFRTGGVSRADLLRVLSALPGDLCESALSVGLVESLGFEVRERPDPETIDASPAQVHVSGANAADAPLEPEPVRAIGIRVCDARERLPEGPSAPESVLPAVVSRPVRALPAVPPPSDTARLQSLWDRTFDAACDGQRLDVPLLVRFLAEVRPVPRLPRRPRPAFITDVCLLLDRRARLRPLWELQWLMYLHLSERLPHEQCRVLSMRSAPEIWLRDAHRTGGPDGAWPEGGTVLIVSDFDRIGDGSSACRGAWGRLIETFSELGNRVVTLGVEGRAPHTEATHIGIAGVSDSSAVSEALLAAMARFHLPRIDQLRALRLALGHVRHCGLGDEIGVWNHPDAQSVYTDQWSLKPERFEAHATAFDRLDDAVRTALEAVIERWRESWPASKAGLEQLIDQGVGLADELEPGLFTAVLQRAEHDARVSDTLKHWLLGALDSIRFAATRRPLDPRLHGLYAAAQRAAFGANLAPPLGLTLLGDDHMSGYAIVQAGDALKVHAITAGADEGEPPPPLSPIVLCNGPVLDTRTGRVLRAVATLSGERHTFETPTERFSITRLSTPDWAVSFGRERDGRVYAEHIDGVGFGYIEASSEQEHAGWKRVGDGWPWASDTGVDRYGLWTEFTLADTTQRLRWIPAGEFDRGSPADERDRKDDETLHHVRLTEGYWLAETACTQALWEAVMGKNPSRFRGAERPVEQVSWKHVREFCTKLNERLPELGARLPTEAEWEYAARAGTRTAFWWGEELTTERANYNGSLPYADGEKGEYREDTVEVKAFEANPWGLYQVHGNVWEWCADWYGEYSREAQENPKGPDAGKRRVLRGGGWVYYGQHLRAACRIHRVPGHRFDFLGFRLAAGRSGAEPR